MGSVASAHSLRRGDGGGILKAAVGIGEDELGRLPMVQWVTAQRTDGPGLSGALSQVPVPLSKRGWLLEAVYKYILKLWPDPRNPPNRPGKAAPDLADIVGQPQGNR